MRLCMQRACLAQHGHTADAEFLLHLRALGPLSPGDRLGSNVSLAEAPHVGRGVLRVGG